MSIVINGVYEVKTARECEILMFVTNDDDDDVSECVCVCSVTQSCLTLCDSTDYSLQGSSVHGVFQARILEQVATSFSRGSS